MSIRVCVAGATGWVGQPLCRAIQQAGDLVLAGAVSRSRAGEDLGALLGEAGLELKISGSVAEALDTPADVLVDYTKPDVVKSNVLTALRRGVHVVIGTSGLTEGDYEEIDREARAHQVGVFAAGNFALMARLLQHFACQAAEHLPSREIIDYAAASKVDAPSGTARELAHMLSRVRRPEVAEPARQAVGHSETRGGNLEGSRIHSVRLPGYVLSIEVIFGEADERLTLRYDAGTSATPYIEGTLTAVRSVGAHVGLTRGLAPSLP